MRELLALAATDDRGALAISVFERSVAGTIAAAATVLLRLDAIVFTGGIGEHAAIVREGIAGRLGSLGVPPVDKTSVERDRVLVAGPVAVLFVVAREDVVIARELSALTP